MIRKTFCLIALVALASCAKSSGGDGSNAVSGASITVVNNRAFLSWTASGGLPDGYYVELSSDGASFTQILDVTETGTYIDGLTLGNTYYFRVRSHNSSGNSAFSATTTLLL